MAQTLDEFLREAREDLVAFDKWWRKKNSEDSEQYPMEMTTGNEGLWWEFLQENVSNDVSEVSASERRIK